jgi:hypothetical protein
MEKYRSYEFVVRRQILEKRLLSLWCLLGMLSFLTSEKPGRLGIAASESHWLAKNLGGWQP